ncbi:hypothetical protein E1263_04400, partial [Kribbella antibiotica]
MVEDHTAGTEYTAADYTAVEKSEEKHRHDGEPPLNRYTLNSDEQPGTTSADLRPEPATDFRSEVPPAPTPDQLDFLVPPPTPRRPQPEPRTENHLSPSLPIPMPEPLAPRERPAAEYRPEQPIAEQPNPRPQPPQPPASTSYFSPAPPVAGSSWRTDQTTSWNSAQHHPEHDPVGDEQPSYGHRTTEYSTERAPERPIEQPVQPRPEEIVELPAPQAAEVPVERAPEPSIEPAPEQTASATPVPTPNPVPGWVISGGPASGPMRNEGDGRADADSPTAINPSPANPSSQVPSAPSPAE